MIKKNASNFTLYLVTGAFLVVSVGSALLYTSQKKKFESTAESLRQSQLLTESKFKTVAQAFGSRNSYLLDLAKKMADKNHSLMKDIENLNQVLSQKTLDIPAIEVASNRLNQNVFQEVNSFNSTKKSNLFKDISQIRALEQYERRIDLARIEFSNWTFDFMKKKKSLEHQLFFKSQIKDITYFQVDHLIRSSGK